MGNYIKRILAILFVLTLAAPVGSHGTFGSPMTISFTGGTTGNGTSGGDWPAGVDPPSASSVCLLSDPNVPTTTCVQVSSTTGEDQQVVRKGWQVRGLTCLKQKNFSAAGDDFDLEFGALLVRSGISTLDVVKISPVLSVSQDVVEAKYGNTELMLMQFHQDINYTIPYDGFVGITIYKADRGGTTSGRFGWMCTLTIQIGS